MYFYSNCTEISSQIIQLTICQQWLSRGLAPNGRQAITRTNANAVHRPIYTALGGDELTNAFTAYKQKHHLAYQMTGVEYWILLFWPRQDQIHVIKPNLESCQGLKFGKVQMSYLWFVSVDIWCRFQSVGMCMLPFILGTIMIIVIIMEIILTVITLTYISAYCHNHCQPCQLSTFQFYVGNDIDNLWRLNFLIKTYRRALLICYVVGCLWIAHRVAAITANIERLLDPKSPNHQILDICSQRVRYVWYPDNF